MNSLGVVLPIWASVPDSWGRMNDTTVWWESEIWGLQMF